MKNEYQETRALCCKYNKIGHDKDGPRRHLYGFHVSCTSPALNFSICLRLKREIITNGLFKTAETAADDTMTDIPIG